MRSILAKSLLIDFLFTPIRLSHGDNARYVAARGMGYEDHPAIERAQGDKPFLSIVEAAILEGDTRPIEYLLGVHEIQAVLSEVAAILRFVPFVLQFPIVVLSVVTGNRESPERGCSRLESAL